MIVNATEFSFIPRKPGNIYRLYGAFGSNLLFSAAPIIAASPAKQHGNRSVHFLGHDSATISQ